MSLNFAVFFKCIYVCIDMYIKDIHLGFPLLVCSIHTVGMFDFQVIPPGLNNVTHKGQPVPYDPMLAMTGN